MEAALREGVASACWDGPRRLRFSQAEYWHLVDQGLVPERTEFVDGEIIDMPPQFHGAVTYIRRIDRVLTRVWHDPDCVAVNGTHVFASGWQPMPDVAVYDALPPRRPTAGVAYPPPRLVVEVSDETLAYDLGEKASRYAREGIEELWVADVGGRRLYVLRGADGDEWRERFMFRPGDAVRPLCVPGSDLDVGEMLPDLYPDARA